VAARLRRGDEPLPEDYEESDGEEGSEDGFVVAGEPEGQVDVEVIGALGGVASGEIGERAAAVVEGEDGALGEDDGGEHGDEAELMMQRGEGQPGYAGCHEEPDRGMQSFDGCEHDERGPVK
jgi:hypothetical protein